MAEFVALHCWGPVITASRFATESDGIAGALDFDALSQDSSIHERQYGMGDHAAISLRLETSTTSSQVWCYVPARVFDRASAVAIGKLFAELAIRFEPWLARSFNELGHGIVQEPELSGDLTFLDWFQYLSPAHVVRLGIETLRHAPFETVELLRTGACCLWLGGSPLGTISGRSLAAQYLGVELRPLLAGNPQDGTRFVVPWT